jgi:Cu+-exporting ATPase
VVLTIVVLGEWLGWLEALTSLVPWPIGTPIVVMMGLPVFRDVIRAALQRQVISHALMTVGMLVALAVGQWAIAAVVAFFMRIGSYAESFTTARARRAVQGLTASISPRRKFAPGAARFTPGGHGTPGGAGQIGVAAGAQ